MLQFDEKSISIIYSIYTNLHNQNLSFRLICKLESAKHGLRICRWLSPCAPIQLGTIFLPIQRIFLSCNFLRNNLIMKRLKNIILMQFTSLLSHQFHKIKEKIVFVFEKKHSLNRKKNCEIINYNWKLLIWSSIQSIS